MNSVLKTVLDFAVQHDTAEVRRIYITAGIFANIIPSYANRFFSMISQGTVAEHAELVFTSLPARFLCLDCATETEYDSVTAHFVCRECASERLRLIAGREFQVSSLEII